MPRPVPGPEALIAYIRTGDRYARIAYRELPDEERRDYRDTVNRVYGAALAHHFGERFSDDSVHDLLERVADRHPQYLGGVTLVLRSSLDGTPKGRVSPRQLLTAQHLVIREIAKLHPGFRARADRLVEDASRTRVAVGAEAVAPGLGDAGAADRARRRHGAAHEQGASRDTESHAVESFSGTESFIAVTLGLDGTMRSLELRRGVERLGGRTIGSCIVRAWVTAEKQRWISAKERGVHDSFPEIGTGAGKGDMFRCEAYSTRGLCRATVDRHGRLRDITFMRTDLLGDDGRHGLADEIREAIAKAQSSLRDSW